MSSFLTRENQDLSNKIILVDGFSSSGKSLLCSAICSLESVENWQIDYTYEQLATLHYLEKISEDSISAILKTRSDELIYNLFIGRNVNFRKTDMTSPHANFMEEKYLKRLEANENQAIKEITKTKPILPIHIHYIFGYSDILLKTFYERLGLYIVMLRDPFYLINRWHKENWVNRIGADNRDFHLCINYKNNIIPWYAKEYAEEYIEANEAEKCFLTVYNLYIRIINMYEKLNIDHRKKVQIIFFENFINHPSNYLNKMCQSLNTKKTNEYKNYMERLSLPRNDKNMVTSLNEFQEKYSKKIRPQYQGLSLNLDIMYKDFFNLCRL